MPPSQFANQAKALAERMAAGREQTLDNAQLRAIFDVSRITSFQREAIVRALRGAGLQILSGTKTEPLVVRKSAAQTTPPTKAVSTRSSERPWFKRKRTWAIAGVLFFLIVGALGSATDSSQEATPRDAVDDTATETVPAERAVGGATTDATTSEAGPTRSEVEDMVDADLYAEARAAAALLGNDDASYIARRIANRLARRTMFALDGGDRSRARFLVIKSRGYPLTNLSREASGAYYAAQARAKARAAAQRAEAARMAQAQADREEAQRAIEAVPDVPEPSAPKASGPSTSNWCGKRDGDGDGIYCE
jgi:hypothetical protein